MLLKSTGLRVILATGVALAFAAPATAGKLYSWVTEDGTYAYSDTYKRIPQRYRSQVKTSTLGKLRNYKRWTPSDRTAEGKYGDRLGANLERLREANQPVHGMKRRGHHRRVAAQGPMLTLRTGSRESGGADLQIPLMLDGEPVVVEEVRAKPEGRLATRHVTVVKRGDDVIAVVKPQLNDSPPVVIEEDDIF